MQRASERQYNMYININLVIIDIAMFFCVCVCVCPLTGVFFIANCFMSQKQQKPTLSGQRIRTRKRGTFGMSPSCFVFLRRGKRHLI